MVYVTGPPALGPATVQQYAQRELSEPTSGPALAGEVRLSPGPFPHTPDPFLGGHRVRRQAETQRIDPAGMLGIESAEVRRRAGDAAVSRTLVAWRSRRVGHRSVLAFAE